VSDWYTYGFAILRLPGRKRLHCVPSIWRAFRLPGDDHPWAGNLAWEAATTCCGRPGPFEPPGGRFSLGLDGQNCRACWRDSAPAFEAAPEHLRSPWKDEVTR
jgi:hypothetical protein